VSPPQRCRLALLTWVLAVVLITFPWTTLQNHPHWMLVRWHPFDGRAQPLELALNVAFYIPGGALLTALASGSGRRRVAFAVAATTLLSLLTETAQLFSHGRVPSMVDVMANQMGAWLGSMVALRRR